jgi:hypothetical protein
MPARTGRRPSLQIPTEPLSSEPVTKAAFARLIGCAKPRITEWIRAGVLTAPAVNAAGLVVPTLAVAQLVTAGSMLPRAEATTAMSAPRATATMAADAPAQPMSYDAARAAHEVLKVRLAELELAERRGELVSKALSDHVLFSACRALRDAWQGWPARHAAVMASRLKVDPALLLAELDRAVRDQLTAVADPKADWGERDGVSYDRAAQ